MNIDEKAVTSVLDKHRIRQGLEPLIDEMSGAELDALAATSVMGWKKDGRFWIDENDAAPAVISRWHPSLGRDLSAAAGDVLLKALGEGMHISQISIEPPGTEPPYYYVLVDAERSGYAPTLPLALVRAICKAVAK